MAWTRWAIALFIAAVLAGIFGFALATGTIAFISRIAFFVLIVFFVAAMVSGVAIGRGKRPPAGPSTRES
jgi:uncharacterized membrane protein YtjA (UPF0391 family)